MPWAALSEDETRHALLAWRISEWAEPRLGARKQRALGRRRRAAVATLRAEVVRRHADDLYSTTGWPAPGAAQALVDELDRALWRRPTV